MIIGTWYKRYPYAAWNSVPSRSMACMMMASRRARATRPLAHGGPPTNAERPLLERQIATIAGEHDIGGLVEQRADPLIADLRDAAGIVDLTGLPSPGDKAEVGADITRAPEAVRFVNGSDKGESRHVADAGDSHYPLAVLKRGPQPLYVTVDCRDCSEQSIARCQQSTQCT